MKENNISKINMLDDRIELSGNIDFSNIRQIELQLLKLLQKSGKFVKIHLGGVKKCDSSLLALVMIIISFTKKNDISIELYDVPEQLMSIAQLSGIDGCLNLL